MKQERPRKDTPAIKPIATNRKAFHDYFVDDRMEVGLVLTGTVIGSVGAIALTRVMTTQLFMVSASDPATFLVVSSVLFIVALMACYAPARRAAGVEPMVALRNE